MCTNPKRESPRRNRGVREAAGQWIAFFDDDQLADPQWLLKLFSYARDFNVRGVGGPVRLALPEDCTRQLHPFACMLLGESRHGDQPFAYSPKVSPGTGNLMLHRSVFEQVGMFNETFAVRHEDTDLFCRMWLAGIEAWYVPDALVHHVTPPERLQECYLARLSTSMGSSVATRERGTHGLAMFAMRYAAKVLLMTPFLAMQRLFAHLLGRSEAALAFRCKRQLAGTYAKAGYTLLYDELARALPRLGSLLPKSPKPA